MFLNWRLGNFKSVYEATELGLCPLTIFAGANSSGKSSFIQSMLLMAQSITNPVYQRPIILNGHIARLGTFSDLASAGSGSSQISIGFDLAFILREEGRRMPASRRARRVGAYAYGLGQDISLVCCDLSFSATEELLRQLQPRLDSCKLRVESSSEEPNLTVEIRRSAKAIEEREEDLSLEDIDPDDAASLAYEIVEPLEYRPRARLYYEGPGGQPVGCTLFHFLPNQLALRYDSVKERATQIVRMLTGTSQRGRGPQFSEPEDSPFLNAALLRRISDLLAEYVKTPDAVPPWRLETINAALQDLKTNPSASKITATNAMLLGPGLRTFYAEHRDELVALAQRGQAPRWALSLAPTPTEAVFLLQYFFADAFRYLGPLRDEPKAAYPMEGAHSPTDVGLRGEHTAAVLDLHRQTPVSYIPSAPFREGHRFEETEVPLQMAVLDWLRYLGVVRELETRDVGLFGHELKVSVGAEDTLHNLVHVGVGVSQVLPILVMSLLADRGSVLVFEQPELHLNPKVQTLLGDFFLSMVWSQKQCIVETHSEYIINRLRYRAALDETDRTSSALGIYFVEREGRKSTYRLVNVNEFGAIGEWPAGFFDQSPEEAERILRAALAKRRRREGNV